MGRLTVNPLVGVGWEDLNPRGGSDEEEEEEMNGRPYFRSLSTPVVRAFFFFGPSAAILMLRRLGWRMIAPMVT